MLTDARSGNVLVMGDHVTAPWLIRWVAAILFALPGPSKPWADIVGHIAWPGVTMFLVIRYKMFLRMYLMTLADRFKTDHVKIGPFEMRPQDPVISLSPNQPSESSSGLDSDDIQRIERMFEFTAEDVGFERLHAWVTRNVGTATDFDEFLTSPACATRRKQAFNEVEGLAA